MTGHWDLGPLLAVVKAVAVFCALDDRLPGRDGDNRRLDREAARRQEIARALHPSSSGRTTR